MAPRNSYPLVLPTQFIQATRDSGYKNLASAIAELIDNALEANATNVDVRFEEAQERSGPELTVVVRDDGYGMTPAVLRLALQFGGSTRFNSRASAGRYGMGLPNSSLSQARRVEVYSWQRPGGAWWSYLDMDDVVSASIAQIPQPKRVKALPMHNVSNSNRGTIIVWKKCDRIERRRLDWLMTKLKAELGRLFREHIWKGKCITVGGDRVEPTDPLFLRKGNNLIGAIQFGPCLRYEVEIPGSLALRTSKVIVRFAELPIEKWHSLPNEKKRIYGISKRAGMSVLRAGREIDYGWFFMGSKRRENYDDWWRCEIQFQPELDELFGVTHTKQGINPTEILKAILSPDIERAAHELNARARKRYLKVRSATKLCAATRLAEERDSFLEPPCEVRTTRTPLTIQDEPSIGFKYKIEHRPIPSHNFFVTKQASNEITLTLNEEHPFYERLYGALANSPDVDAKIVRRNLELLLLAAARAGCHFARGANKKAILKYCEIWSNNLAAFLA